MENITFFVLIKTYLDFSQESNEAEMFGGSFVKSYINYKLQVPSLALNMWTTRIAGCICVQVTKMVLRKKE